MSDMSDLRNRSQSSARRSDYVWQYEYYDDEEPVSFEGLRAHRYSIVIGFWVGLAVFVIFMFFVLTLLTKTGAPHPENAGAGKRREAESCLVNISGGQDEALSRPFLAESHSYFNFYSREPDEGEGEKKTEDDGSGRQSGVQQLGSYKRAGGISEVEEAEEGVGAHSPLSGLTEGRDGSSLSHFNIPNFVSSLGEDELLCDIREQQQDPLDFYHR